MNYLSLAMESALAMGAGYADMRIQNTRSETIYLRNLSLKNTSSRRINGYGIRVLKNGAWGFAHHTVFSKEVVLETVKKAVEIAGNSAKIKKGEGIVLADERSYIDTYRTPVQIDPFTVPLTEKIELMLDRVLGWEADYAGISFATPEKLKSYRYGSELVNFSGDNTLEGGLATAGYDDDGVPGQKWITLYLKKPKTISSVTVMRMISPLLPAEHNPRKTALRVRTNCPISPIP